MTAKKHPRHFAYKHPTFGTSKTPNPESSWKKTVYYWWWEFLKRSENYLRTCESGGKEGLIDLYEDFGDVREITFKDWWTQNSRGYFLFSEPSVDEIVRVIGEGEIVPSPKIGICVLLPLNLPKKHLKTKINKLLLKHHDGRAGIQNSRHSFAKYRVSTRPYVGKLEKLLQLYDLKKSNPNLRLWQIGNECPNYLKAHKIRSNDTEAVMRDKKNVLAASVKRHLTQAHSLIEKVEKGIFP